MHSAWSKAQSAEETEHRVSVSGTNLFLLMGHGFSLIKTDNISNNKMLQ